MYANWGHPTTITYLVINKIWNIYTYVSKNAGKKEMRIHDWNKSPITRVFGNMELYLYIACKPNGDNTNIIQSRSFSRREATSIFLTKCTQIWFAVASILESTLVPLKYSYSNLSEAFLRSHNAGCYDNAFLLLSLPSIGARVGIRILRYDLSDHKLAKMFVIAL